MSLNISDAETCRMAVELARLTGETTTGAVTIALREQLERERRKRDVTLLAGTGTACHWPTLRRCACAGAGCS